jgi:hypothetical protein
VEKAGIEPAASALQGRRSPNVSYIPNALLSALEEARARCDLRPPPTCLLVHASRVRFELTSNRIKSPAPYRSSHRPNKSRRRDSNPQPSGYEPDELPIAPLRSSGARTRTCDMRRNRTPFYSLNYTGMSPDQDSPDRGLLISCTIRFSRVKRSNSPKTAKRVPLGRAKGSIPKLDHL